MHNERRLNTQKLLLQAQHEEEKEALTMDVIPAEPSTPELAAAAATPTKSGTGQS